MMKHPGGFTLTELLAVIAIISIIAAFAIPSYTDHVRRGQASEAATTLSDLRVRLEQFYQDNLNYGTGGCGIDAGGTVRVPMPAAPAAAYFTYACAWGGTADNQSYLLTATGSGGGVVGSTYTLNEANAKATTSFKGNAVSKGCWLLKGSEC